MIAPNFEVILTRISDLERADAKRPENPSLLEDADDLVNELFTQAARTLNLRELSARLRGRHDLDIEALRKAARFFRDLPWAGPVALTPALTVNPPEQVAKLESEINNIEALNNQDPTIQAAFGLDITVGGSLLRLTMCAFTLKFSLEPLLALAREKLRLPSPEQVVTLWSYLQREFDPDRDARMEPVSTILPADFLRFDSDAQARDKLARYIAEYKPRLMLALSSRNGTGYPLDVPGIANVLAWRSSSTAIPPSLQEQRLGKAIRRLVGMSTKLFSHSREELAEILRIEPKSLLLGDGQIRPREEKPAISALCYELRKASRLLSELSMAQEDLPTFIRRYKLGIEVMSPHLNEEFSTKNELMLQRELSRFLLERGIFVVGTRFGSGQTDLVSWEKEALYIVETKLFKGPGEIRRKAITDAFAQLRTYMDTHPTTPRGVLVIYNMSASNISAPEHWLRNRFLFIAVNMQSKSPSLRTHSIEILEGDDDKTIQVVEVGRKSRRRRGTYSKD
jgi:hypothetical protein